MWRIERVLGIAEKTLRYHYPEVFSEDPLAGAAIWEPSPKELQQVEVMAGLGLSHKQIALVLGITPYVLRSQCPDVLDRAEMLMNLKVGANLYKMATGSITERNTIQAAIWWTKARMAWKDTSRVETTGANGTPLQSQVQIVLPDNGREDQQPLIEGSATSDDTDDEA
jgi:hypothetical protein